MKQVPTPNRIVNYVLSSQDVASIKTRRLASGGESRGNDVQEGDVFPMLMVRVWGNNIDSCVNGQVFLDGNDMHWATSVQVGEGPGKFQWPERT